MNTYQEMKCAIADAKNNGYDLVITENGLAYLTIKGIQFTDTMSIMKAECTLAIIGETILTDEMRIAYEAHEMD